MYVCGLARIILRSSYNAEVTIAFDCNFIPRALSFTARRSINMKPILWRLSLYSRPGLPRPMIRKVSSVMCQVSRVRSGGGGEKVQRQKTRQKPEAHHDQK